MAARDKFGRPVVVVTGMGVITSLGAAALHDVALVKPFSLAELLRTMDRLLLRT